MPDYKQVKINISEGQRDKIRNVMQSIKLVSIKLKHADLQKEHVIAITQQQVNKLTTAWQNGERATIRISNAQLQYNLKHVEGGVSLEPFYPH